MADAQTEKDAARWRALINSPRLRIMGTAGFDKEGKPAASMDSGYMHFGLEVWSRHSDETTNGYARAVLTNYADARIAAITKSAEATNG